MGTHKALIGSLFGAVIGIAIWAAVAHFTGSSFGLFAAFLGIFVGVGAAAAAGPSRGQAAAVCAAGCALLSVLAGKAAVAWVLSQKHLDGPSPSEITEEYLISCIADEVVAQYEWEGYELDYPAGADLENPDSVEDYPADVWEEAASQWSALPPDAQLAFRDSIAGTEEGASLSAFLYSLLFEVGIFGFVWIGLAVSSAYKITRDVPERARKAAQATQTEEPQQFFGLPGMPPLPAPAPAFTAPAAAKTGGAPPAFIPGAMIDHAPPPGDGETLRRAS